MALPLAALLLVLLLSLLLYVWRLCPVLLQRQGQMGDWHVQGLQCRVPCLVKCLHLQLCFWPWVKGASMHRVMDAGSVGPWVWQGAAG